MSHVRRRLLAPDRFTSPLGLFGDHPRDAVSHAGTDLGREGPEGRNRRSLTVQAGLGDGERVGKGAEVELRRCVDCRMGIQDVAEQGRAGAGAGENEDRLTHISYYIS